MTPLALEMIAEAGAVAALTPKPRPLVAEIQAAVCHVFEIDLIEMRSARRSLVVARPRQVAMYLAKKLTLRSLPEIGRMFGDRDHSTVIHAVRRIADLMQSDAELSANIAASCVEIARRVEDRIEVLQREAGQLQQSRRAG